MKFDIIMYKSIYHTIGVSYLVQKRGQEMARADGGAGHGTVAAASGPQTSQCSAVPPLPWRWPWHSFFARSLERPLATYVLHVYSSRSRELLIKRYLQQAGFSRYSLVQAVTNATLDAESRNLNFTWRRSLPRRTVAVALSHVRVLRAIAAGRERHCLVLEDDVVLARSMRTKVISLLDSIPSNSFDLLFLTFYAHLTDKRCTCSIPGRPDLRMLVGDGVWSLQPWGRKAPCVLTGMNGYVATREGARRVLAVLPSLRSTIDTQIGLAATRTPGGVRLMAAWPPRRLMAHNWTAPSIRVRGIAT